MSDEDFGDFEGETVQVEQAEELPNREQEDTGAASKPVEQQEEALISKQEDSPAQLGQAEEEDDEFGDFGAAEESPAPEVPPAPAKEEQEAKDDDFGDFDDAPSAPAPEPAPPTPAPPAPAPAPAPAPTDPNLLELEGEAFRSAVCAAWVDLGAEDPELIQAPELTDLAQLRSAQHQLLLQGTEEDSALRYTGIPLPASATQASAAAAPGTDASRPAIKCSVPLAWKGSESEGRLLRSLGLAEVAAAAREVEAAEEEAARVRRANRLHGQHSSLSMGSGSLSRFSTSATGLSELDKVGGHHHKSPSEIDVAALDTSA